MDMWPPFIIPWTAVIILSGCETQIYHLTKIHNFFLIDSSSSFICAGSLSFLGAINVRSGMQNAPDHHHQPHLGDRFVVIGMSIFLENLFRVCRLIFGVIYGEEEDTNTNRINYIFIKYYTMAKERLRLWFSIKVRCVVRLIKLNKTHRSGSSQ